MQIEIFTVCDNAQNYQGKTVIVGTFNKIISKQYPFVYQGFSIVGRIAYEECGEKEYTLSFISPTGINVIEPLNWKMHVNANEGVEYADFALALNQIRFEAPGIYEIKLETEELTRIFKLYLVEQ